MVKRQNNEADQHLQNRRAAVNDDFWQPFLQRQSVEKTVGEFGQVFAAEAFELEVRDSDGEFERRICHQPPLQKLHRRELQIPQNADENQPRDNRRRQNRPRRGDAAARDQTQNRLNAKRQSQSQQTYKYGVHQHQPDGFLVQKNQAEEPLEWREGFLDFVFH